MERVLVIVAVALCAAGPAFGDATATFSPQVVNVPAGSLASFEVTVASGVGDFDSADLVIGAADVAGVSFVYSSDWTSAFDTTSLPEYATSTYGYDYLVGVGGSNPTSVGASLLVGTVTFDTTGMAVGDYPVRIDFGLDSGASTLGLGGVGEPVYGVGTIHIPEPASLMLLGMGAVAALRRRRA